jgi:hypothetical protein
MADYCCRVAACGVRVAGYGIRSTGYELWIAGFKAGCWDLSGISTASGLNSGQFNRKRNFVGLYRLFLDCGSGF